jgi:hypothetical protein
MKTISFFTLLIVLGLPACGNSEPPNSALSDDPLQQVPDADAAAAEADSINLENADQALSDLEKELDADQ